VSARDRYQRSLKDERADGVRHGRVQQELQYDTAFRTIQRCLNSPNRERPGTFAAAVVELWMAADGGAR